MAGRRELPLTDGADVGKERLVVELVFRPSIDIVPVCSEVSKSVKY